MLIDRKLLIEKEIESLTEECAKMYLVMVRADDTTLLAQYETKKAELASLQTDLELTERSIEQHWRTGTPT